MAPPLAVYLFVVGSMLPLLHAQATESTCQSGHYYDRAIRSCKPCVDICEPLRGTMPDCQDQCPDIYCSVVCDTERQMMDKCFGETCQEYADKNVQCSAKHTMPPHGEEKNDRNRMFSGGGIAVCVGSVLVSVILCAIATFFITRRMYIGNKSPIEAAQEKGHQPGLDSLVIGWGETNTLLNGAPNGQLNGALNGQLNGALNGQLNGVPNGHQNEAPNGHQNAGSDGQLNGRPNAELNGGPQQDWV